MLGTRSGYLDLADPWFPQFNNAVSARFPAGVMRAAPLVPAGGKAVPVQPDRAR
ncbi:hypothetical protein REH65_22405 [Saccharopolyspora sp. ID03-671]|uniref:hypothetical protein n=1 Tax=Saccharopolyspora sp. ID03-671 TaxID=3073066 RepID=UPI0032502955